MSVQTETALIRLLTDRGPSVEKAAQVELHGNDAEGYVIAMAELLGWHPEANEECLVIGARVELVDGTVIDQRFPSARMAPGTPILLGYVQWDKP